MTVSEDKLLLQLKIDKELTAEEVETLISDLGELRARMQPEVDDELPTGEVRGICVQKEPSTYVEVRAGGGVHLRLRNDGLGWLAFNFTHQQAISLRDFFLANVKDGAGAISLLNDQGFGGDKSH